MTTLEILHYPDERLHLRANKVNVIDDEIKQIVNSMAETMYEYNGIGLAATQVNIQKRIFIMDLDKDNPNLQIFINPEIINYSGEVISEEGCLSVPGVYEKLSRFDKITVKYQDITGKTVEATCEGLMSICFQHELDHLNGKVMVEYLSNLKQKFIKKKMKRVYKPE